MNISLRNSAKAIIVQGDKVLLLQKQHPGNPLFTVFPGGGQEPGETLVEALARECLEEIGAKIRVGDLLYIREYRSWMHEFHNPDRSWHQVEFFFLCELIEPLHPDLADNPDLNQKGVIWVERDTLKNQNLYPKVLRDILAGRLSHLDKPQHPIYLGAVN